MADTVARVDGHRVKTGQEWAEVCFVHNWAAQEIKAPPIAI